MKSFVVEPWISVEQLVSYLGISKETIYRWLEKRRIPAHRVGKLWKFKPSEIDDWVKSGGANENQDKSRKYVRS